MAAQAQVIDLSNPDIHQSAALLKQACMDSGFFYVINHGINEELMAKVFDQTKKFFALPLDEKMKHVVGKARGYRLINPWDEETQQQGHGEGFSLIEEYPDADKDEKKILPRGSVWPPADDFPEWKETMLKYQEEILDVGRAVSRIIAVALGVSVDFFDKPELLGNAFPCFTLNHYGVEDLGPSKEYLLGATPHGDPSLITLLATDEVPGLQICMNADAKPRTWKDALPRKGAFIVIIGDMLGRITNGIFRSTMHRVRYCQDRYVVVYFVYPSPDCTLECIPICTSAENPPMYPPIKGKELLKSIFVG